MKQRIVANWKANVSADHAEEWVRTLRSYCHFREDRETILAVPFLYLERIFSRVSTLPGITLAAQGISPYPPGNYTGATPASWLRDLVDYILVGHRERRKYFHETAQDAAAQVRECVAVGIRPILCLDDDSLSGMRAALDSEELAEVICAYTPDSAVALETALDIKDIQAGIARVSGYFPH
ncbi:MAG TPA: triosephosphate isomerase, partial [Desulfobulbus sp.]|nr:triosephosphate isomerase [Desulfobulbus sp.]